MKTNVLNINPPVDTSPSEPVSFHPQSIISTVPTRELSHADSVNSLSVGETDADASGRISKVTIRVKGEQPFTPGQFVELTGRNILTDTTFLFITGPAVPRDGGKLSDPGSPIVGGQPESFDQALVRDDDIWTYKWNIPTSIGWNETYMIYAENVPNNLSNISGSVFANVSIRIKSPGSDSLQMMPGWNYLSSPGVMDEETSTMRIFSGVNSSGHSIFSYNGENSTWVTMKPDDPFIPLMGIWVFSASNSSIPICIDSKKAIPNRSVFQGWNGIGITGTNKTVEKALVSVQPNWSYLLGYNATIQQYDAPVMNGQPEVNTSIMKLQQGYWLFMKNNGTLSG